MLVGPMHSVCWDAVLEEVRFSSSVNPSHPLGPQDTYMCKYIQDVYLKCEKFSFFPLRFVGTLFVLLLLLRRLIVMSLVSSSSLVVLLLFLRASHLSRRTCSA